MITFRNFISESVEKRNEEFINAIENYKYALIKKLFDMGVVDIDYEDGKPLKTAVHIGDFLVVKFLLDKGASLGKDEAFLYSLRLDDREISDFLLKNGADIHFNNDDALKQAIDSEDFYDIKYLVENGAYSDLALIIALKNKHFEIVKYLVDNGFNIHINNDEVLNIASRNNYLDIVKYLVSKMDPKYVADKFPEYLKFTRPLLRSFSIED